MGVRWKGRQAVLDLKQRAAERNQRWSRLFNYERQGKVAEFFAGYAEYLQWDGIYSSSRRALYNMAKAASEKLQEQNLKNDAQTTI
jgi:hypothetical protein